MISERLSKNSSSKEIFDRSKMEYEKALNKSGYKNTILVYTPVKQNSKTIHKCKIVWFNPSFNKNKSTNIGKTFLHLIHLFGLSVHWYGFFKYMFSEKINKIFRILVKK